MITSLGQMTKTTPIYHLEQLRLAMVEKQLKRRGISDSHLLTVFETVPRHVFVEEALQSQAYEDYPLPIGEGQTISQPYIVALMLELLQLKKTDVVLELGTGTGYQTSIISHLVQKVYTIERLPRLSIKARNNFYELGYFNITTRVGDGTLGWKEKGLFNAIVVSAASPKRPDVLFDQLAIGGRLIIPVGSEFEQELCLYEKTKNGIANKTFGGCRFVKLMGKHGW